MFEPELKLYSELRPIFDDVKLSVLHDIAGDEDVAWQWMTDWRWEIFDYALDDELLFDYTDVDTLQDYACRYLEQQLNEGSNE